MTKKQRRISFDLDDSSLVTPEEMEALSKEVKGTWISLEKDGETRQVFLPKIDHVCTCKRFP